MSATSERELGLDIDVEWARMPDHGPAPVVVIDDAVCAWVREQRRGGDSIQRVASRLHTHKSRVRRHLRGACAHVDAPERGHLMCDPAYQAVTDRLRARADETGGRWYAAMSDFAAPLPWSTQATVPILRTLDEHADGVAIERWGGKNSKYVWEIAPDEIALPPGLTTEANR